MTSRYPLAEPIRGTGDLDVSGPVGAQQLRDFRQRGFWAKITAQPDAAKNAYGFIRCDDFTPTAALTALAGAVEQGDGVSLAAYEVTGSKAVPTDGSAIVWMEPLRVGAGYTFKYVAAGSLTYGSANVAGFSSLVNDTWVDTGLSASLPAAGTYRLHLTAQGSLLMSAPATGTGLAQILGRIFDATAFSGLGIAVPLTEIVLACCGAGVVFDQAGGAVIVDYPVSAPTTIKAQAMRSPSGGTINLANFNQANLGWLKLS